MVFLIVVRKVFVFNNILLLPLDFQGTYSTIHYSTTYNSTFCKTAPFNNIFYGRVESSRVEWGCGQNTYTWKLNTDLNAARTRTGIEARSTEAGMLDRKHEVGHARSAIYPKNSLNDKDNHVSNLSGWRQSSNSNPQ